MTFKIFAAEEFAALSPYEKGYVVYRSVAGMISRLCLRFISLRSVSKRSTTEVSREPLWRRRISKNESTKSAWSRARASRRHIRQGLSVDLRMSSVWISKRRVH